MSVHFILGYVVRSITHLSKRWPSDKVTENCKTNLLCYAAVHNNNNNNKLLYSTTDF